MPPGFHTGTPIPELTLKQAYRKARAERDAFDARRSQAARGHPMGSLGEARVAQQITPPYGSLQAPIATPKNAPVGMPRPYHPMSSLGGPWAKGVALMPHVTSTSSSSSAGGTSSAVVPTPRANLGPDKRRDAPSINYSARGDKKRGLEVVRSP